MRVFVRVSSPFCFWKVPYSGDYVYPIFMDYFVNLYYSLTKKISCVSHDFSFAVVVAPFLRTAISVFIYTSIKG